MNSLKRAQSITNFKKNIKTHLKRLRKTGQPEIITVKGRPALVVQNVAAFHEMVDAIGIDARKSGLKEKIRAIDRIRNDYKLPSRKS